MLKMLIVEDEKWEREGLVDFLDWNSLGIELSGVACDGVEGIEKARLICPDIIITDIKMPGMDGLKMSRSIREFMPFVKIVILTGYDDFKLAKEAISISANAYILKPVEEDELLDVLKKVIEECSKDNKKKEEGKMLKVLLDESLLSTRRELLSALLKEKVSEEILHRIISLGIIPYCGKMAVFSISLCPGSGENSTGIDEAGLERVDMDRIDVALKSGIVDCGIHFTATLYEKEGTMSIIVGQNNLSSDMMDQAAEAITAYYQKNDCHVFIGIGAIVERIDDLYLSGRQAKDAMIYSQFWGDRYIVPYPLIENLQHENASSVGDFLSRGNYFTKQLMQSLRAADEAKTHSLLQELFQLINDSRWADSNMISNFLYGLLNETSLLFYNTILTDVDEGMAGILLLNLSDLRSIREHVFSFFNKALAVIREKRNNKDESIVKKVEQIIEERYKSDISIKTVAAEIYLSPNYLGSIFKKCTGKPLNDYLCQYRMEKAKEMLQSPKNKVSKVAREVGIPNVSYFCLLFKDMFGIAPGEYQEIVIRGGK